MTVSEEKRGQMTDDRREARTDDTSRREAGRDDKRLRVIKTRKPPILWQFKNDFGCLVSFIGMLSICSHDP